MVNKRQFRISNTKKVLHKVGKHWAVMSALTLALLGGASAVTTVHASTPVHNSANTQIHTNSVGSSATNIYNKIAKAPSAQSSATSSVAPSSASANSVAPSSVASSVSSAQPSSVASHAQLGGTRLLSAPEPQKQQGTWDEFGYVNMMTDSEVPGVKSYGPKQIASGTNLDDLVKNIPGCTLVMGGHALSDESTTTPTSSDPNTYTFVYTGTPNGQSVTMPKLPSYLKSKSESSNQVSTKQNNNQADNQKNNTQKTVQNNQNQHIGRIIIHYINATKGESTYGKDIIPPKIATGNYSTDPTDEEPSDMFHMDDYAIQYLYKNNKNDKFGEMTDDQVSDYIHNHSDTQHYPIGYSAQNEGLADSDVVSDVNGDSNYGKNNLNLNTMTSVKPMFFQPYDQNVYVYFTRDKGYIQVQYSDELTHQQIAPTKNFSDVTGAKFDEHPYAPKEINGFHLDTRYLDAGYDPETLTQFSDSQPNDGDNHVKMYSYLSYLPNVDHVDYKDAQTGWLVGQWQSTRPSDVKASNYDGKFMMFNNDFHNGKYDGLSNGYEVLSDTASDFDSRFNNDIKKDNNQYHYGNYNYTVPVVKKSFIDVKFFDGTPDKNGNHAYLGHHQVWSYENQPFNVDQYSEFVPKGYSAKLVNNMPKLSASVVRDNKYANDGNPNKFLYDNQIMGVYVYKKAPVKATNTIEYVDGKKVIKTLPKYTGNKDAYDANVNGQVITDNLPKGYKITEPITDLIAKPTDYDNSVIKVPVKHKVAKATDTIEYTYNGKIMWSKSYTGKKSASDSDALTFMSDFANGTYDNMPKGYEVVPSQKQGLVNHINAVNDNDEVHFGQDSLTVPVQPIPQKSTVTVIFTNNKGNIIKKDKPVTGIVGNQFNMIGYEDQIPAGYEMTGTKNAQYFFPKTNQTVQIVLGKARSQIMVYYYDLSNNQQLKQPEESDEPEGAKFNVNNHLDNLPKGYKFIKATGVNGSKVASDFTSDSQTVDVYLQKPVTVTVHYVDENGKTIASDNTYQGMPNDNFQFNFKTIPDYSIDYSKLNQDNLIKNAKYPNKNWVSTIVYKSTKPKVQKATDYVIYTYNGKQVGKTAFTATGDTKKPDKAFAQFADNFGSDFVNSDPSELYKNAGLPQGYKLTKQTFSDYGSDFFNNSSYTKNYGSNQYKIPVITVNNKPVTPKKPVKPQVQMGKIDVQFVEVLPNGQEKVLTPNNNLDKSDKSLHLDGNTVSDDGVVGQTHDKNNVAYDFDTILSPLMPKGFTVANQLSGAGLHGQYDLIPHILSPKASQLHFESDGVGDQALEYMKDPQFIKIGVVPVANSKITVNYVDNDKKKVIKSVTVSGQDGDGFDLIKYEDAIPMGYNLEDIQNGAYYFEKQDQTTNLILGETRGRIYLNFVNDDDKGNTVKTVLLQGLFGTKADTSYDNIMSNIPAGYEYKNIVNDTNNTFSKNDQTITINLLKPQAKVAKSTITVKLINRDNGQFQKYSDTENITTPFNIKNYLNKLPKNIKVYSIKGNRKDFDYNNHSVKVVYAIVKPETDVIKYVGNGKTFTVQTNHGNNTDVDWDAMNFMSDFDAGKYDGMPKGYQMTKDTIKAVNDKIDELNDNDKVHFGQDSLTIPVIATPKPNKPVTPKKPNKPSKPVKPASSKANKPTSKAQPVKPSSAKSGGSKASSASVKPSSASKAPSSKANNKPSNSAKPVKPSSKASAKPSSASIAPSSKASAKPSSAVKPSSKASAKPSSASTEPSSKASVAPSSVQPSGSSKAPSSASKAPSSASTIPSSEPSAKPSSASVKPSSASMKPSQAVKPSAKSEKHNTSKVVPKPSSAVAPKATKSTKAPKAKFANHSAKFVAKSAKNNHEAKLPQTNQSNNSALVMIIGFIMGIVATGYRDMKKHFE